MFVSSKALNIRYTLMDHYLVFEGDTIQKQEMATHYLSVLGKVVN